MSNENQWRDLKEYGSKLRQSQSTRLQRLSESQSREKKESEHQQSIREQARRELEQRQIEAKRIVEQQTSERKSHSEETRNTLLVQSAQELRIANQRRYEAQLTATQKAQEVRQFSKSGSPIETAFSEQWRTTYPLIELKPQFSIGKYRVDFAHVATMTAIELDGHATHHSRRDRTKDARRERWIQAQGWHVVRFTGSEVHADAISCVAQAMEIIAQRSAQSR